MANSVPFTNPVPVRINFTGSATTPGLTLAVKAVKSGIGFITVKGKVFAEVPNGSVRPRLSTVPLCRKMEGRVTLNCVVLTNVVTIPDGMKAKGPVPMATCVLGPKFTPVTEMTGLGAPGNTAIIAAGVNELSAGRGVGCELVS